MLAAGLLLLLLSGCSPQQVQAKQQQARTREMSSTAQLIASITPEVEVNTGDSEISSGTAAAANSLIWGSKPNLGPNSEDLGKLAEELRQVSDTERYRSTSAPTVPGVTRMGRLYIYTGDCSEDFVARCVSEQIVQMDSELSAKSRQVVIDSYYTYTYTYSVSVRQAYSGDDMVWLVGVGVDQTAKEEHKT